MMEEVTPEFPKLKPTVSIPEFELVQRRTYREILAENVRTLTLIAGVAVAAYFGAREGAKSGIGDTTWYLDIPPRNDESTNTEDTVVD